jgi:hypothetical protein
VSKEHAEKIIFHAEKRKSGAVKVYDEFVFWFAFLISVFGNFFVSVAMVPILLVASNTVAFIAAPLLGFGVRMAVELFMKNVAHLRKSRHDAIMFISAAIGLAMVYVFAHISNILAELMKLNPHNPQIIAILYTIGFLIPFLFALKQK